MRSKTHNKNSGRSVLVKNCLREIEHREDVLFSSVNIEEFITIDFQASLFLSRKRRSEL
jgi:hypothetical protein